jgi:hypothetical protein
VAESLSSITFAVENRSGDAHRTQLDVAASGNYEATVDGQRVPSIQTASGARVEIPLPKAGAEVRLTRR